MVTDPQDSARSRRPDWAAWAVSMLNGMVGDYLHDRANGLAIDMALYHHGRPLALTPDQLLAAQPHPTPKLCILIHGLGCNEGIWAFRDPASPDDDTTYGMLLQGEHGYTPFYVRYNTGLSIAENGKQLRDLLDQLVAAYAVPVDEIMLIGHSMGGLIIRSACHYGATHASAWVQHVAQIYYLGTPHEGANLAKFGHTATNVLAAVGNPITKIVAQVLDRRSQGVKDLRFGTLLDASEIAVGDDERLHLTPEDVPWLTHAHHYLLLGTLTSDTQHAASVLFGDGLVVVPGSREQAPEAPRNGPSTSEQIQLFPGIHHLQLAHDPAVYRQIEQWCRSA